jgi:two-component sensor histidine kinase
MIAKVYATDTGRISVRTEIEDIALSLDQTTPVTLILNELLSNAFKHAFPDGRVGSITVTVRSEQGQNDPRIGYITVRDDGVGIPDDFDLPRATSTGLRVFLGLLRQIDGQVDLERGGGTAFNIRFPLAPEPVTG